MHTFSTKPKKSLGQNFLASQRLAQRIIDTAEIKPNDIVVEIGPGKGALTLPLAQKAKRVIAIEKDRELAEELRQNLASKGISSIEVITGDILKVQSAKFKVQSYKVVANLPYNIATAVIMRFLTAENKPELMAVMVQKEVGQRMITKPPKMSRLAVFSQLYSDIKISFYIKKENFYPKPKVNSALLLIKPLSAKELAKRLENIDGLTKIIRSGFGQPRKQLINNLSVGLSLKKPAVENWLARAGIKPSQRPGELSVDDWIKLSE